MMAMSIPTSARRYFTETEWRFHKNTFRCGLDLFGLDIFRVCPSLFYSTGPWYISPESL